MPTNPGLSPALQQALQRRGLTGESTPALNQVSESTPTINPIPSPTPQSDLTQASAPQGAPTGQAPQLPKFQPQDRTDLITLALIEQMKNDNKLQKEQTKVISQPSPQPPVGGGGMGMMMSENEMKKMMTKMMMEEKMEKKPMGGGGMMHQMSNGHMMSDAEMQKMKQGMGGGGFTSSPDYAQPMPINQMQGEYQSGQYSGLNNYGQGS